LTARDRIAIKKDGCAQRLQAANALVTSKLSVSAQERNVSTAPIAHLRHPNSQYRYAIAVSGIGAHYGFVLKCGNIPWGILKLEVLVIARSPTLRLEQGTVFVARG
jgi:hypothetical protein